MPFMKPEKRSYGWARLLCLVVSIGAMFLLLRRIHGETLRATVQSMRPGWFLAAVALYGLLFLPAAWRWHLALRLNGSTVHCGATTRLSLIGHFFYTIL